MLGPDRDIVKPRYCGPFRLHGLSIQLIESDTAPVIERACTVRYCTY